MLQAQQQTTETRQRLEQWKEAANQNAAQVAALSEQLEQTRSMLESIEARCRELEAEITDLKTKLNDRDRVEKRSSECITMASIVVGCYRNCLHFDYTCI